MNKPKHVIVSVETHKRLSYLRTELGVRSIEAVIVALLQRQ